MKFPENLRWIIAFSLAACMSAFAAPRDKKDKGKEKPTIQTVDSGSFSVFVRGQHVATETFNIQQQNSNSVIKSQMKQDGSDNAVVQQSDLEITSSGMLLHYEWSQGGAGGSLSVVPSDDFLLERISASASAKPAEQPFLMPNTSAILDNNFFVHREVLAWRFLAADCKQEAGDLKCQKDAGDFGVLVPQDRMSMHVRLELIGKEKVRIRGTERELLRLNLTGDTFNWVLWLDDHDRFKLMRVEIPADNIEVLRD